MSTRPFIRWCAATAIPCVGVGVVATVVSRRVAVRVARLFVIGVPFWRVTKCLPSVQRGLIFGPVVCRLNQNIINRWATIAVHAGGETEVGEVVLGVA